MTRFLEDARYAVRRLASTPVFTGVAVASLAIGIGANTAVFTLLNAILFVDDGIAAPERVVDLYEQPRPGEYYALSLRDLEEIERRMDGRFSAIMGLFPWTGRVDIGDASIPVYAEVVAGDYFGTLGVRAALGRTFSEEERTVPGGHPVVVVSHRFWRERLGADPAAIGGSIRLNGRGYTIVGVTPENFRGKAPGMAPHLWAHIAMRDHLGAHIGASDNLFAAARLAPGVTTARARAEIEAVGARIEEELRAAGSDREWGLTLLPLDDVIVHGGLDGFIRGVAALLSAVVGLVLLVACTNLASFLLARATERRREVAIRLALGARRRGLVRLLLTESLVLGTLGGIAGLGLGLALTTLLLSVPVPIEIPITLDAGLDGRVLAFTAAVSTLAALFFGLFPALYAARTDLATLLRDEAGAVIGGRRRQGLRGALVVAQVSVSLVLLVGAGLFTRSLARATSADVGFDTGGGAVVRIDAESSGYREDSELLPLQDRVLAAALGAAGVGAAGLTNKMPLGLGNWTTSVRVPGVEPPPNRDFHVIDVAAVSPGYLGAMGIPLLAGRDFLANDDTAAARVVVISQAAADLFWPGEDPLGRTMTLGGDQEATVIGVAGNVKLKSLTEPPTPYIYRALAQSPSGNFFVVARGSAAAPELAAAIRRALRSLDPDLFVPEAKTMAEHMGLVLYLPRMAAALLSALGALALLLSLVGLYGIVSYGVSRRTREVGLRTALGATPGDVVRLLMRGGLGLAVGGAVIGLLLAFAAGRVLGGFLVGIRGTDPLTFVLVPALLLAVATLAAWLPARKAARTSPLEALRTD